MRNLSDLRMNEGGKPVGRPPPTSEIIDAFQSRFGVRLPQNYLKLLRHSNGGHPELDSIELSGRRGARWSVNRFYYLDDDKSSAESLWAATEKWMRILGEASLPFANDGGGNQFFLGLKIPPASVKICVHDENFSVLDVAPSFEAFIDGLSVDPDMI